MPPRHGTLRRALSRLGVAPTLAAAALLLIVPWALAAPGDLDPTFGTGGIVVTTVRTFDPQDVAQAVTVLPDGRIAVAGFTCDPDSSCVAFIAVYTVGGTLDPTFGDGGIANIPIPGVSAFATAIAVQPGRGIVFGGTVITAVVGDDRVQRAFVVARVGFDGTPDPTFGDGGTRTTTIMGDDELSAIAVQPDGKIVAAGWASDATDDDRETIDFAVARYDANGTLDPAFGQGGVVTTDFGFYVDEADALALQPDGKIVVAGVAFLRFGSTFAVARYDTNGALDPTFAGTGKTTITDPRLDRVRAVVVEPGGRIVLAGSGYSTSSPGPFEVDFALARLDPNGTLDTSFGTGGLALTDLGGSREFAHAIVRQPDGKLLVAGEADGKFAVVRYQTTGALDASFGTGGVVLTAISAGNYAGTGAQAAVLQADGALVAAGFTVIDSSSFAIALVRYQGGVCGNGVADAGEACDDGNLTDGDGCDTNCTTTACGNGVRTGGEACDDGNTVDGDCCSAGCGIEAAGSPCDGDGNGCTDDVCDGAGFCGLANVAPCDDGSPCTGQDTCGGAACDGTPLCGACERCNEAVGCVAAPSGCFPTYTSSMLAFSRDRLTWRADELLVEAPRLADDHTLCIFDESGPAPRLVFAATAPGTGACAPDRQSCWRVPTRKHGSFVYRNRAATPDGVTGIRILPDHDRGRVSVKVKAPLPGLPLSFPLRVQLMTNNSCSEATYRATDVTRNDATGLRATLRPR